jgi:hypothetical protein
MAILWRKKRVVVIVGLFGAVLLIAGFDLAVMSVPSNLLVRVVGDAMDWRSRSLAGWHSINCGRVRIGQDPKGATECALKAHSEGRPFRVRYDIMGFDSAVAGGIVRTPDGHLYGLSFDGDPAGQGGVSLWRQRVGRTRCPEPTHLYVNPKGRLNCFQQRLSPPTNIMSPNIEPY